MEHVKSDLIAGYPIVMMLLTINMFLCLNIFMRTTLDLQDELLTEIKILAAQERMTLKELIGELLRAGIRLRQQPARQAVLPPVYPLGMRMDRVMLQQLIREGR